MAICILAWGLRAIWLLKYIIDKPIKENKWIYSQHPSSFSLCMLELHHFLKLNQKIHITNWLQPINWINFGSHIIDLSLKDITLKSLLISSQEHWPTIQITEWPCNKWSSILSCNKKSVPNRKSRSSSLKDKKKFWINLNRKDWKNHLSSRTRTRTRTRTSR